MKESCTEFREIWTLLTQFYFCVSVHLSISQIKLWFICMGVYTHTYKLHQNTHPSQHVSVNMLYILQNTCTRGRRASFFNTSDDGRLTPETCRVTLQK